MEDVVGTGPALEILLDFLMPPPCNFKAAWLACKSAEQGAPKANLGGSKVIAPEVKRTQPTWNFCILVPFDALRLECPAACLGTPPMCASDLEDGDFACHLPEACFA
jgi:hypothetical protein